MRLRLSLAGQFLVLQLCIVLVVVGVVAAVSITEADTSFRRVEGRRLLAVAEYVAADDTVRLLLDDERARDSQESIAERSRAFSGASFVFLVDSNGVARTGIEANRRVELGPSEVLSGRAWVGITSGATMPTGVGKALVAHVPVIDPSGRVVGAVIVGLAYPSLNEQLASATSQLLTYLLIGISLGVVGSLLLARRVKRKTLGLEPREIAGLVEHREAMLHGIREGLIGTDDANRITLVNDEAERLLGLPADAVGKRLDTQPIAGDVIDVLSGRVTAADQLVISDRRVLVLNRMPVRVRGRPAGWVTTLRDRTELTSLEHELDASRHATDTLRAQAHEFTNRLHTIAGLVQLGEYDEVVRYIAKASQARDRLTEEVTSRVADPALAALLIAKASLAAEQSVTLKVAPATRIGSIDEHLSADLVTVVGNLVDNALDAADAGGWIEVELVDDEQEITVCVRDSGPGVPPELLDKVFRRGYTTKTTVEGQRGLGLALTRFLCTRRGGGVSVEGARFTARLPYQAGSRA
jgi:sensor histidine kinase regulating citrate/malate metabolism